MPPIFQICPRNRFFCVKFQNWVCFCPVPTTFVFLFWLKNPKFFDVTGNFSDVNFASESCSFYVHFRFSALGWDVHFVVCARARARHNWNVIFEKFTPVHLYSFSISAVGWDVHFFCARARARHNWKSELQLCRARVRAQIVHSAVGWACSFFLKKWTSVVPRARAPEEESERAHPRAEWTSELCARAAQLACFWGQVTRWYGCSISVWTL